MNRPQPGVKEMYNLQRAFMGDNSVQGIAYMKTVPSKTIKYLQNNISDVNGLAVSHDYYLVNNFELEMGRYFSDFESQSGTPAIILGYEIYQGLFGTADPIDKEINYMGRKLRVVGVVKKQGQSLLETGLDDVVLLPVLWVQKVMNLRNTRGDQMIMVRAAENVPLDELENELKGKMRSVRKLKPRENDDFALNRITMISKQLDQLFWSVNMGGFIIGIFAVLVGGFGIANIMFVSVKERTNQIGIQKSLGAHNSFILIQFLTEAIVLSLIGGLLGIVLVMLITAIISAAAEFSIFLSAGNFIFGTGLSVIIGIISGFIPAWTASRLDPVEAIRTKI
jgi:putative ABC transport system permease protein